MTARIAFNPFPLHLRIVIRTWGRVRGRQKHSDRPAVAINASSLAHFGLDLRAARRSHLLRNRTPPRAGNTHARQRAPTCGTLRSCTACLALTTAYALACRGQDGRFRPGKPPSLFLAFCDIMPSGRFHETPHDELYMGATPARSLPRTNQRTWLSEQAFIGLSTMPNVRFHQAPSLPAVYGEKAFIPTCLFTAGRFCDTVTASQCARFWRGHPL